jgi:hypothetical protein
MEGGHVAAKRPVVIVHGYSDKGESASAWCRALKGAGYDTTEIHVADYVTLTNEITVKDIAEAFDRAVRLKPNLSKDEPFDAIVHSTGMLVIRSWLTTYERRKQRLKHLVGLAPATFGSPLAAQGRSLLGAVFKGRWKFGPDFLEQGDLVLSNLELGSEFTWKLAHLDLLAEERPVYGPDGDTPYPFIFVGLQDYGKIKSLVTESLGTDGTVRWCGVGFNCRKIVMDLSIDPSGTDRPRVEYKPWANTRVPLVMLPGYNHGSIFGAPEAPLVDAVAAALQVDSNDDYDRWKEKYERPLQQAAEKSPVKHWQQFVTHLVDERGDGIGDYYVDLYTKVGDQWHELQDFAPDVHAFREDPSYRCFHIDVAPFVSPASGAPPVGNLWLRLIASSGTKLISYFGYNSERIDSKGFQSLDAGKWDAAINLTEHLVGDVAGKSVRLFQPFTTTLVEIRMNREPMPLGSTVEAELLRLIAPPS